MADHFEDNISARLSALEGRVDAEVTAVEQHFAELQQFITFSLTSQSRQLRVEWREDSTAAMRKVDERFISAEHRLDNVEQRLGTIEQKMDAHHHANQTNHAATQKVLDDILTRLPAVEAKVGANHAASQKKLDEILTRLPTVEAKVSANHAASQKKLDEILSRLPKSE